jgi:hypothetical protein
MLLVLCIIYPINITMFYKCPTKPLGYIPIHKNASTTFVTFFQREGWVWSDDQALLNKIQLFSHIQSPWRRYIKGVTELAWNTNERNFKAVRQMPFFKNAMLDGHLLPISIITHGITDKIHFIPIDIEVDSITLTNQFLKQHRCKSEISRRDNQHQSSLKKQLYQKEVETWINAKHLYSKQVKLILKDDFALYQSVLDIHSAALPVSWWRTFLNRIWISE